MTKESDRDQAKRFTFGNLIDDSTVFVDRHLRLVQNIVYASFGVTVLMIARRARLATRFINVSEIPQSYITKRITLRGSIRKVSGDGILHVQHIPAVRIPLQTLKRFMPFRSKVVSDSIELPVKLVGLSYPESHKKDAVIELEKHLHRVVSFKLFYRDDFSNRINEKKSKKEKVTCLHCLVSKPTIIYPTYLNYYLLRKGLAQVKPLPGSLLDSTLTEKLFKAQQKAVYWRKGIWKDSA